MEKEKFDLQKRHTENIQDLLEDTNVRLNKMEGEYLAQTQSTVNLSYLPFPCSLQLHSPAPQCSGVASCLPMFLPGDRQPLDTG